MHTDRTLMKYPLKLLVFVASAAFLMFTNTSCTSTEAAIVGGIAGAALGAAIVDDNHYGHGRGYRGGHGGHYGGHYGGGYGGGFGYNGYCPH
jgi:uncharacterized membrane protein